MIKIVERFFNSQAGFEFRGEWTMRSRKKRELIPLNTSSALLEHCMFSTIPSPPSSPCFGEKRSLEEFHELNVTSASPHARLLFFLAFLSPATLRHRHCSQEPLRYHFVASEHDEAKRLFVKRMHAPSNIHRQNVI